MRKILMWLMCIVLCVLSYGIFDIIKEIEIRCVKKGGVPIRGFFGPECVEPPERDKI